MRRISKGLLFLVIILIAVRAALPIAIQSYVNRVLDRVPSYDGHIGDVDLQLFRGAYEIEDVEVVKTDGEVPVPFFKAAKVDLSVEWKQLLNRAVVGEVVFIRPELNFVVAPSQAKSQLGDEQKWTTVVKQLFPIRINRLEVRDGSVHYRDFHGKPEVDIYLSSITVVGVNLTNSEKLSETLTASLLGEGLAMQEAPVDLSLKFDPYQASPTFDLDLEVKDLSLPKLNTFFRHYAGIDVQGGTLSLYVEAAAKDGFMEGYAKPFLTDLNVVDLQKEKLPLRRKIKEGFIEFIGNIFENEDQDTTATRIPFKKDLTGTDTGLWSAIASSLRHALIRALDPAFDGSVNLADVEEKVEKKKK